MFQVLVTIILPDSTLLPTSPCHDEDMVTMQRSALCVLALLLPCDANAASLRRAKMTFIEAAFALAAGFNRVVFGF